jgi:hypothetical protein
MPDEERTRQVPLSGEPAAEPTQDPPKAPAPTATGNDKITILKHRFSGIAMGRDEEYPTARLELAIRNVSNSTIATALFEAVFYDGEGNIVDTVRHTEVELRPETSRAIHITSAIPISEDDGVVSYAVRLVRAATADTEKVQFRTQEMRPTESGEEEVSGVVKNLSEVKLDAAVVIAFFDPQKENIGTRVLVLKDMEPNTVRTFALRFRPQEGDTVRSCTLAVGEIVE